MATKRWGVSIAAFVLAAALVGCGGDENTQSSDELRDEIITLLFAAAANGASADGSDPASVVLKALEDNPELLDGLGSDQLAELRDALVAPQVAEGEAAAQEAAPETLADEETDTPDGMPAPDTATPAGGGAAAPVDTAAPSNAGGSSGTIVSIPPLTFPTVDWGRVSDILNSGSGSNGPVLTFPGLPKPTTALSPVVTMGSLAPGITPVAKLTIDKVSFTQVGAGTTIRIAITESGLGDNDVTSLKLYITDGGETLVPTNLLSTSSLTKSVYTNRSVVPRTAKNFKVVVTDKSGVTVTGTYAIS